MSDHTDSPELYPEVASAGSLAGAVQTALNARRSSLVAQKPLGTYYCRVSLSKRSSQIMVAAEARAFSCDFWDRGVCYGSIWASELTTIAEALDYFIGAGATVGQMVSRFSQYEARDEALPHEQGRLVEHAWQRLLSCELDDLPAEGLKPIIEAAALQPALRQLMPYTSLWRLCFSRCTGYPYTQDCPVVESAGGANVRVYPRYHTGGVEAAFEGSIADAMDFVVANLPVGCERAIDGTADDYPTD